MLNHTLFLTLLPPVLLGDSHFLLCRKKVINSKPSNNLVLQNPLTKSPNHSVLFPHSFCPPSSYSGRCAPQDWLHNLLEPHAKLNTAPRIQKLWKILRQQKKNTKANVNLSRVQGLHCAGRTPLELALLLLMLSRTSYFMIQEPTPASGSRPHHSHPPPTIASDCFFLPIPHFLMSLPTSN